MQSLSECIFFLTGPGVNLFILFLNTQMASKKRSLILQPTGPSCAPGTLVAASRCLLSMLSPSGDQGCRLVSGSGDRLCEERPQERQDLALTLLVAIST